MISSKALIRHDYVSCKCGEIAVDGGDSYFRQMAKNPENFLRLADDDTIIERMKEKEIPTEDIIKDISKEIPTKRELMGHLKDLLDRIQAMPDMAKTISINHYDYESLLILLLALFNSDCASDS